MMRISNTQSNFQKIISAMAPYLSAQMPTARLNYEGCTVDFFFVDIPINSFSEPVRVYSFVQVSRRDGIPVMCIFIRPSSTSSECQVITYSGFDFQVELSPDEGNKLFSYGALFWKKLNGSMPKGFSQSQLHSDYRDTKFPFNERFIPQPLALIMMGNPK